MKLFDPPALRKKIENSSFREIIVYTNNNNRIMELSVMDLHITNTNVSKFTYLYKFLHVYGSSNELDLRDPSHKNLKYQLNDLSFILYMAGGKKFKSIPSGWGMSWKEYATTIPILDTRHSISTITVDQRAKSEKDPLEITNIPYPKKGYDNVMLDHKHFVYRDDRYRTALFRDLVNENTNIKIIKDPALSEVSKCDTYDVEVYFNVSILNLISYLAPHIFSSFLRKCTLIADLDKWTFNVTGIVPYDGLPKEILNNRIISLLDAFKGCLRMLASSNGERKGSMRVTFDEILVGVDFNNNDISIITVDSLASHFLDGAIYYLDKGNNTMRADYERLVSYQHLDKDYIENLQ